MINLSFDELRLIAQLSNISNYENKSKEDLIKALSEIKQTPKPETSRPETKAKTKPGTPKPEPETPKPETSKTRKKPKQTKAEPEPEPKPEIGVYKKKLKNLRKDFDGSRYKFSKKEIKEYRKAFYVAKNKKYLSESEINKTNKNLTKLKNEI